jgi:hypothetical protein
LISRGHRAAARDRPELLLIHDLEDEDAAAEDVGGSDLLARRADGLHSLHLHHKRQASHLGSPKQHRESGVPSNATLTTAWVVPMTLPTRRPTISETKRG